MPDLTAIIFNAIIENSVPARRMANAFRALIEAAEYAVREKGSPSGQGALELALRDVKKLLAIREEKSEKAE